MIETILKTKRDEVKALRCRAFGPRSRPMKSVVFDASVNIIAELKRRSPSAGFIADIEPERIAVYGRYAKAISVLTDAVYFGGSYEFLAEVAGSTDLPVLCKDFIIDRTQIDRAYSVGADMVLLIARIVTKEELENLLIHARKLGMASLVELHDKADMEKIRGMRLEMVGVNARDLDTLGVDLDLVADMLPEVTAPYRIAESGIKTRHDIERMRKAGANGFLIGETLMRSPEPQAVFEELLRG